MSRPLRCQLIPHARSVGAARVFTSATLEALGVPLGQVEDCVLVVDELVTNAVKAEQREAPGLAVAELPPIGLTLETTENTVLMAVKDASPRDPVRYEAGPEDENHRGEMLVQALCGQEAQVFHFPDGTKEVRASMPLRAVA